MDRVDGSGDAPLPVDGDERVDIVPPDAPTGPPVTMLDLLPRIAPPDYDSGHDCGCDSL